MPGSRPFEILLIEDNPADIALTREVLTESRVWHRLSVCMTGREALDGLRGDSLRGDGGATARLPHPDIILLDLNLPQMDGREFLAQLRADPMLQTIPVVVLTTSGAHEDVLKSYQLHCNAFVQKPMNFDQFVDVIHAIEDLWLNLVELPPGPER